MSTPKTLGIAALSLLALTGCTIPNASSAGGDVVIATSYSRSGHEHSVECAANPGARLGDYRVVVSSAVADQLRAGDACPAGPHEPTAQDRYPELYDTLQQGLYAPMPYEGGNAATCGEWGTVDPAVARRMAEKCPPVTRGDPY